MVDTSSKMKFVEYTQPTNVFDGGLALQQKPDLGYQHLIDNDTMLRFGGNCSKKFEIPFGGRMVELCKERERNLDTSGYIRNGAMISSGFGNVNEFSKLRFGEMTRQANPPAEETEVDRIHALNRNYGVMGFYPYPEDTRIANKKYTNFI
jgi:hypothetical protein